jgi:hypothetical protein
MPSFGPGPDQVRKYDVIALLVVFTGKRAGVRRQKRARWNEQEREANNKIRPTN